MLFNCIKANNCFQIPILNSKTLNIELFNYVIESSLQKFAVKVKPYFFNFVRKGTSDAFKLLMILRQIFLNHRTEEVFFLTITIS